MVMKCTVNEEEKKNKDGWVSVHKTAGSPEKKDEEKDRGKIDSPFHTYLLLQGGRVDVWNLEMWKQPAVKFFLSHLSSSLQLISS